MNKTQIEQPTINLEVLRDGNPDYDYMHEPPTIAEAAVQATGQALGRVVGNVALQTKMLAYDTVFRTNYRSIRNTLAKQERNKRFEQSIGLISLK